MGTLCTTCAVSSNLKLKFSECKGVEDPECTGVGGVWSELNCQALAQTEGSSERQV